LAILKIDQETCNKCGACAAVCPGGIILFRDGAFPRPVSVAAEVCVRCGHCVGVCPTGSLTHDEIPVEACLPIEDSRRVSLEQCGQLIKGRRSIRAYRDRPVPREEIESLIDIARYAPTGHNEQDVRWYVIDDPAALRRIEETGQDWLRESIAGNPVMAKLFGGIIKRLDAGHPDFIRGAPALIVAHTGKENRIASTDCTIALSYFDLAANAAGLGCCWAGFFMMAANSYPALKEALALPGDQQVCGTLMLGYPKYAYRRIPTRRPARVTWR
jgi:nitroreductase/NAD-dependent dihydropyrimidine dehydrogenase PreA subunit